jgi:aldose 1-epimerase
MDAATDTVPSLSGTEWTITADGHEAVVVEVGGALRAYRHQSTDLVDGYEPAELCPGSAGKVMAPWPNRVRDGRYTFDETPYQLPITEVARHTAIHGLVSWVRWSAAEVSASAVELEHELVPQPGYPWPLLLRTRWSVGADGLTVTHEATNPGATPAPFGLATHPYLLAPGGTVDDVVLEVPGQSRVLLDGRLLPIGTARVAGTEFDFTAGRRIGAAVLDVAFGDVARGEDGRSVVTLRAPSGGGVTLWADEAFRWWQVFTGDTLGPPRRRRSIAVEPMTCPPDALRSGRDVVVLPPGGTWRGRWGISPVAG